MRFSKFATSAVLACSALLSFVSNSAFADLITDGDTHATGVYLEPGLLYETLNSNINYGSQLKNSTGTVRGEGVVGRLGFHLYEQFFVAADARFSLINFNDNANGISTSGTSYDVAPVIGYQMKDYGVRFYVSYVLAGNIEPKSVNGVNLSLDGANGWRAGAGLKLKHLSINVEWQKLGYTRTNASLNGQSSGVRFNPEGLVASVTVPLEL